MEPDIVSNYFSTKETEHDLVYNVGIGCGVHYIKWMHPSKRDEKSWNTPKVDKKALKYVMIYLKHAPQTIMRRSNGRHWKNGIIESYLIQHTLEKLSNKIKKKIKVKNITDYRKWIEVYHLFYH